MNVLNEFILNKRAFNGTCHNNFYVKFVIQWNANAFVIIFIIPHWVDVGVVMFII